MAKFGRPTKYKEEIANEILMTISTTSKGLKKLCKENKHWPCEDTIYVWLFNNKSFSEQYDLARRNQAHVLAAEIIEIADNSEEDYIINDEGRSIVNKENINRSRLRVDSRKWVCSKVLPKIYGDKILNEISGVLDLNKTIENIKESDNEYKNDY